MCEITELDGRQQGVLVELLRAHLRDETQLNHAMQFANIGRASDHSGNGPFPEVIAAVVQGFCRQYRIRVLVRAVLENPSGLNGSCPPIDDWLVRMESILDDRGSAWRGQAESGSPSRPDPNPELEPAGRHPEVDILFLGSTSVEVDALSQRLDGSVRMSLRTLEYSHGQFGTLDVAVTMLPTADNVKLVQQVLRPRSVVVCSPVIELNRTAGEGVAVVVGTKLWMLGLAQVDIEVESCRELSAYFGRSLPSGSFARLIELVDVVEWHETSIARSATPPRQFAEVSESTVGQLLHEIDVPVTVVGGVIWKPARRNSPLPKDRHDVIYTEAHEDTADTVATLVHEACSADSEWPHKDMAPPFAARDPAESPALQDVWIVSKTSDPPEEPSESGKPFVNRDPFRADLIKLLEPGHPRWMVVRGPQGSGKSYLLEYIQHLRRTSIIDCEIVSVRHPDVFDPPEWNWQHVAKILFDELRFELTGLQDCHDPSEFVSRHLVSRLQPERGVTTLLVFDGFTKQGVKREVYDLISAVCAAIESRRLPTARGLMLGCELHDLTKQAPFRLVREYRVDDIPQGSDIDNYIEHLSRQFAVSPSETCVSGFRQTIEANVARLNERLPANERHLRLPKMNAIFERASRELVGSTVEKGGT